MHFVNYGICIVTLAKVTVRIIERIDISPPSDLQMSFRSFFLSSFLQLGLSEEIIATGWLFSFHHYTVMQRTCVGQYQHFCVVKIASLLSPFEACTVCLLSPFQAMYCVVIVSLIHVLCMSSSPFPARYVLSVSYWYRYCVSSSPFPGRCVLSLCHWYMYCVYVFFPPFQVDVCCQCVTDVGTVCLLPPFQVDVCCFCVTDTCSVCVFSTLAGQARLPWYTWFAWTEGNVTSYTVIILISAVGL